jgi:hypothetical protein
MSLCPMAVVAGCRKCAACKVCTLKTVLCDQPAKSLAGSGQAKELALGRRLPVVPVVPAPTDVAAVGLCREPAVVMAPGACRPR